jgi:hypothetical protein
MTFSYYAPSIKMTVPSPIPIGMPTAPLTVNGAMPDCVVACDMGRAVIGIVDGQEAWRKDFAPRYPRSLDVFEGLAFMGIGSSLQAFNPRTGHFHRNISVPAAAAEIRGLRITRAGDGTVYVAIGFNMSGAGSARLYRMDNLSLTHIFTSPYIAQYPRCAEWCLGWLFVCDTFGHRVYGVDVASGGMRDSVEVYFPNYIEMLSPETGLITAEHENRIIEWTYHPSVSVQLAATAPVTPFDDVLNDKTIIEAQEAGTFDPNSAFTPPKSLCAVEASGTNTLYSPNSARKLLNGDLLIADTDNHRVVVWSGGAVVAEATGFNSPVTAIPIT